MKSRDLDKREHQSKPKAKIESKNNRTKPGNSKVKYNHKNHWLAQEDDDYDLPILKTEEE
ncbi:hypothetical protein N9B82_05465 [Saprospiraceae bacterium]|nr:hypothetical protein [Saprospiraceae bacterium]